MQNYGSYNPYLQNFQAQMQQQHQVQQPQQQGYKVIPISNKNETNSVITDFNGTPIYFHNLSSNEIYIKQFDIKTGLATLQEFKRVEQLPDDKQVNVNPYADDFKSINKKLDSIEKLLTPIEEKPKKVNKE